MNETAALVRCLRKSDLVYFKRYLYVTSPGKNKLVLRLAKLILTTKGPITDKDVAEHLYNALPDSRLSHLKKRLKNAVLKTFLLQEPENVFKSKYSQNYYVSLVNVLNTEILISRGVDKDISLSFLKEWKDFAEQNNHYLPYCQISLREHEYRSLVLGMAESENSINQWNAIITEYKEQSLTVMYFHEFVSALRYKKSLSNSTKIKIGNHKDSIDSLITDGSNFLSRIYRLCYHIYYNTEISRDFTSAELQAQELVGLVKTNAGKVQSGVERIALALKAVVLLNNNKYQDALNDVNALLLLLTSNMNKDYLTCLELKVILLIRSKEYSLATIVLEEIKSHLYFDGNRLFAGHIILYEANLAFLLCDKPKACKLLRQNNYLAEDKEGWFLGIKIMEIIIALDDKDINSVEYQFKTTRAQLQRYPNSNAARLRRILKVAQAFVKTRNYSLAAKMAEAELQLLYEGKDEFYWDPRGFEVIRFDRWFLSKATKFQADWIVEADTETP